MNTEDRIPGQIVRDDKGLTLIEILVAVTIMSIISVTIMSYFVAAIERSTEENRRIIAANLARLKVAEIRDMAKQYTLDPARSNYHYIVDYFSGSTDLVIDHDVIHALFTTGDYAGIVEPETINGTTYYYEITFSKTNVRMSELDLLGMGSSDNYLLNMLMKVSWSDAMSTKPAKETVVDSYIVDRRD